LALALTLGIKVACHAYAADTETQAAGLTPVAEVLERKGFMVDPPPPNVDPEMLAARKVDCSLRIAEVSPLGWHRDVLARLVGPHEQLRFAFRGELFANQPVWRTFIDYNWRRLLGYAGLRLPNRPVFGILASPGCDLQDLPWDKLAELR
jgi:hypothetical protein